MADVALVLDDLDPWVVARKRGGEIPAAVGGGVIDNQGLDVDALLRERAVDAVGQEPLVVVTRDDDADAWPTAVGGLPAAIHHAHLYPTRRPPRNFALS